MPGLRQFAFPSNPFAIIILLATVAAAVWALSPAQGPGGLHASRSSVSTPAGTVPVYVVRVSLADGRYSIGPQVAGQPLSLIDTAAAITGTADPVSGVPSGRLVIGGRQLVAGDPGQPALGLADGRAAIGTGLTGWPNLVGGGPLLVQNGRATSGPGLGDPAVREPRVAVALSGRELWLVGAGGPGLTVPELQKALVSMGARSAIAFAAGEGADMVVGGRPLLGHVELTAPDAVAVLSR
jgi:hypothetical protein